MKFFIVGGSGATGKRLIAELLKRGHKVRAVVRSKERMEELLEEVNADLQVSMDGLELIEASILDLSDRQLEDLVRDCDGIASCLGHNISLKGLFGHPRSLVTDSIRRLGQAVKSCTTEREVKLVLMNTTANVNNDVREQRSVAEKMILRLLRLLLPPHRDNEDAAEYLRSTVGQDHPSLRWVAVRPDTLIEESSVSEYSTHRSPTTSPLFNPGKTSRINVAHFMAELLCEKDLFKNWEGQMPVLYNREIVS